MLFMFNIVFFVKYWNVYNIYNFVVKFLIRFYILLVWKLLNCFVNYCYLRNYKEDN